MHIHDSQNDEAPPITYVTRDYTLFTKHPLNVREDKAHQKFILASIKSINMLKYHAILVDAQFRVLDGWNRLIAAKEANYAIYYQIVYNECEKFIQCCQNQKGWDLENRINYYAGMGNRYYQELLWLAHEKTLRCIDVLYYALPGAETIRNIKKGTFKFDVIKARQKIDRVLSLYYKVCAIIRPTGKLSSVSLETSVFKRGIATFSRTNGFDEEFFIKKLECNLPMIYKCYTAIDVQGMFLDIYNSSQGPRGKKIEAKKQGWQTRIKEQPEWAC